MPVPVEHSHTIIIPTTITTIIMNWNSKDHAHTVKSKTQCQNSFRIYLSIFPCVFDSLANIHALHVYTLFKYIHDTLCTILFLFCFLLQ